MSEPTHQGWEGGYEALRQAATGVAAPFAAAAAFLRVCGEHPLHLRPMHHRHLRVRQPLLRAWILVPVAKEEFFVGCEEKHWREIFERKMAALPFRIRQPLLCGWIYLPVVQTRKPDESSFV